MPLFFAMSRIVVRAKPIFWKSWSDTSRIFFLVASFLDSRLPMMSFRMDDGGRETRQASGDGAERGQKQGQAPCRQREQDAGGDPGAGADPGRSPAWQGAPAGSDPDPDPAAGGR